MGCSCDAGVKACHTNFLSYVRDVATVVENRIRLKVCKKQLGFRVDVWPHARSDSKVVRFFASQPVRRLGNKHRMNVTLKVTRGPFLNRKVWLLSGTSLTFGRSNLIGRYLMTTQCPSSISSLKISCLAVVFEIAAVLMVRRSTENMSLSSN